MEEWWVGKGEKLGNFPYSSPPLLRVRKHILAAAVSFSSVCLSPSDQVAVAQISTRGEVLIRLSLGYKVSYKSCQM